jgi:purine-nucleoside phosphorylase
MRNSRQKDGALLSESVEYILKKINGFSPEIGIILGTGLGGLVKDVNIRYEIEYNNIPHFPVSTVESHHGNLIFGEISGKNSVIMQGRFHYYEGYSMYEVTYPVNVMNSIGVKTLLVSNACGAVNPFYKKADLMIMKDHINFFFDSPVNGTDFLKHSNRKIYDDYLISLAEETALEFEIPVQKGVYFALRGPTLETVSEYRMVRKFGADVVGMSTIPEALVASTNSFRTLGLSIVTDVGLPDSLKPAVISEILEAAAEAEPKLTLLTKKVIEKIK